MTLSNLSDQIRKISKGAFFALLIIFFLWISWLIISGISNIIFQPVGDDIAYGKIAPPIFTKTYRKIEVKSFTLETELPKTSKNPKAKVFKVESGPEISIEDQEKIARSVGFTDEKKTSSENVATWKDQNGTKLIINASANQIEYDFNYQIEQDVLSENITISEEELLSKAENTLKALKLLPDDIETKKALVEFFFIKEGSKKPSSQESANAVEISYFRNIDSKTSVGDPPIKLLLSQNGDRILELDYFYSHINKVGSHYPIISAEQALDLLKEGKAFAQINKGYSSIKLKEMKISYWESHFIQPYLQPIWVFQIEGVSNGESDTFKAYLPAIDPFYLTFP